MDAVDALTARLWPLGDHPDAPQVHAVIDAARDPRMIGMLDSTGLEHCCLFAGTLSPALRAAAPHRVHLAPGVRFTREWLQHGWGRSWGVLTVAPPEVTLPLLRRHLRTLLRVHDVSGRALMFRFYDPRVLRTYLSACSNAEAAKLFGPVHTFVSDTADGGGATFFHRDGTQCGALGPVGWTAPFRQAAAERHCEDILHFLRRCYPGAVSAISDETARERIRWGLRRIGQAGVTDSRMAALFVVTQFTAGPAFHQHPSCAALLADRRVPPDARVESLFHAASNIPWDEIAAARDDNAWLADMDDGAVR